jgi:5-methylcytosine-specific restriction endonuclease McrA
MQRAFNRSQKRHLYLTSNGKCHCCGGPLGADWEADHTIRYAHGGVTEITNGTALCERCHVEKHRYDKTKRLAG